jgi:hypothetical protein
LVPRSSLAGAWAIWCRRSQDDHHWLHHLRRWSGDVGDRRRRPSHDQRSHHPRHRYWYLPSGHVVDRGQLLPDVVTTGICILFEPPAGKWIDKVGPDFPITVGLSMQAVALAWIGLFFGPAQPWLKW